MEEYIPNKQEIAYHEAGHAVTGYLFFPPVELVNALPENASGRSAHGTTKCNIPFPDFGEPDIEKEFPKYLKIIINALSGKYFQSTILGIDDQAGAASDYGFLSIYIYDESYIAFKPIWEEITVAFCSNPTIIAMVDKVAAVLQEKPELSREDLETLLKDDIVDFDELIETIKQQYFEPFCEAFKAAKNTDGIIEETKDQENFPEEEV